jgi:Ca2+-binding EF-hand superfamily protein
MVNSYDNMKDLFAEMDDGELGGITFESFLKMMNPDRTVNERADKIKRVFRIYDRKNRGLITFDDFRAVVKKENLDHIDDKQLKEVIEDILINYRCSARLPMMQKK